jgi:hypothetical protein
MSLLLIAPVVAELIWLVPVLSVALTTTGAVQKVTLVEVVSSNVDIVVWLLGWWNPTPNKHCDAERFRARHNFSRGAGKLWSLLHLPTLVLCGVILWKNL